MDTVPGQALNIQIHELACQVPGVQAVDSAKAHRFGQYLVINLAIFVDGAISVDQGDRIADQVEETLVDGIDFVRAVHVHFHSKNGTQG